MMNRLLSNDLVNSLRKYRVVDAFFAAMVIGALSFYDLNRMNIVFQMGFIALTLWEVICKKEPLFNNRERNLYIIWYVAFTAWALLSRFWAKNLTTFNSVFIAVVQVAAIGIATVYYLYGKRRHQLLVWVLAAAAFAFCIRFFVQVPFSIWGEELRIKKAVSFFSNRGPMAMSYIALVMVYLFINKNKHKWVLLLIALLSVFVSLMFGTRKVLVFLGVGTVVHLAMKIKTGKQALILFGGILIAGALAWVLMMKVDVLYGTIGYRFEKMFIALSTGKGDGSTITRQMLIRSAFDVFKQHPVTGIGLDGFRYVIERATYAHNNYMELLASLGLIGLFLYYWFPLMIGVKAFISKGQHSSLIVAFIVALLFTEYFQVSYASEAEHIFIAVVTAFYIKDIKNNHGQQKEHSISDYLTV